MAATSKSMLVYVILLAFVSLAIVVILRAGSHLQAPPSVGGLWQVIAPVGGAENCQELPFSLSATALTIQQSGPILYLYFTGQPANQAFKGHLAGLQFEARSSGDTLLTLQGSLDRQTPPNEISATLAGANCPAPVSFTGVRQGNSLGEFKDH